MEIKTQDLVWQKPILGTIQKFLNNKPIVMQILKFAAIGVLNTAIDFIILNFISKTLEISSGFRLGTINVFGFIVAVVQSYFWNQAWTFGSTVQSVGLAREALRLLLIGCLGAGSIVAVLAASQIGAAPIVYFILLVGFVVAELALWYSFGLRFDPKLVANSQNFLSFILVSTIGLLINSAILSAGSAWVVNYGFSHNLNPDLIKNLAKMFATTASLAWNFIGYKLLVFRK